MSEHPAADLIEQGFCKGVLARDENNNAVRVPSDKAVRFCVLGAIERAYSNWRTDEVVIEKMVKLRDLAEREEYNSVYDWSDDQDQETVVATLKKLEL